MCHVFSIHQIDYIPIFENYTGLDILGAGCQGQEEFPQENGDTTRLAVRKYRSTVAAGQHEEEDLRL